MSLPQRTQSASIREVSVVDHELTASTPAERSWAVVYERNYPRLCRSAARMLGSDAANDAVQDGMLEAYRLWPTLAPEQRTDAYVRRVVKMNVIDAYRQQRAEARRTARVEEAEDVPIPAPEDLNDAAMIVDRIIAAMPEQRRAVCLLVYEDGLTIREAATQLNIAYETARTHMKLAHLWIRKNTPPEVVSAVIGSRPVRRLPPGTGFTIVAQTEAAND